MTTVTSQDDKIARRTRRTLDKLVQSKVLSEDGLKWLITATDPFHDTDIDCSGYPDMNMSRSVVQCITKTVNVNPHTVIGDSADLLIHFNPLTPIPTSIDGDSLNTHYRRGIVNRDGTVNESTGLLPLPAFGSGLNVTSIPEGQSFLGAGVKNDVSICLPIDFTSGNWRLIACGWEAVNTTPVINQAGSITAFRSPSYQVEGYIRGQAGATTCSWINTVPHTQSEAVLFPDSRTWAAAEGLYQVACLNSIENHYVNRMPGTAAQRRLMTLEDYTENEAVSGLFPVFSGGGSTNFWNGACNRSLPWNLSGAFFTGLTPESSFQITCRYFLERVPTVEDPNLLVLTRTPAGYDPVALEIYSQASRLLPVGVMVSENPLGEWFDTVMDVVSTALPIIGGAIGTVFAPAAAIGSTLGFMASEAKKYNANLRADGTMKPSSTPNPVAKRKKPLPQPPKKTAGKPVKST